MLLTVALAAADTFRAQSPAPIDVSVFSGMRWRAIGPFNGGRTLAPVGSPAAPHVFYVAVDDGGIWKTTDAGRSWAPVFDTQATGSIGAIAVAPDAPHTVYAGSWQRRTGGAGLYRSGNGGGSWTHLGLASAQRISKIVIAPGAAPQVFVAVASAATPDGTGVFKIEDGSARPSLVLGADGQFGAVDLEIDRRGTLLVAVLARLNTDDALSRPELHRSIDGGRSWQKVGQTLPVPAEATARLDVALTASGDVLALVQSASGAELHRSSDIGDTWRRIWTDANVRLDGSPIQLTADPRSAQVVYLAGHGLWRSVDGGVTFVRWGGAASDADGGQLWIHPTANGVALLASTEGAIVTLNDGETWSPSDNQPTAAYAGVVTDRAFPYRACAVRSGADVVCTSSRSGPDTGAVAPLRLRVDEAGSVAPDPTDPEVLFTGAVIRYDRRTGQSQMVSPPPEAVSDTGTRQVVFAPTDSRTLLFASRGVWKSTNGGQIWAAVGPSAPNDVHVAALSPSPVDGNTVWLASDTADLWVTRDSGLSWRRVSLPASVAVVTSLGASHFDPSGAYVAASTTEGGSVMYLTRNGGTTWTQLGRGMPPDARITTVREDPFRRGLLFAGTDHGPFMSFDDGTSWHELRLNLPFTTVTGIAIRDADVVIATRGRGLWILEDIAALRQMTADTQQADVFLLRPSTAWRARYSEAAPPVLSPTITSPAASVDGALLTYYLARPASEVLAIEIIETAVGEVVRRFSSDDPSSPLPRGAGLHRVPWDLRYSPLELREGAGRRVQQGPPVAPGTYQVRLTLGTRLQRQAVIVRMDPRVTASASDILAQSTTAKRVYDALRDLAQEPTLESGAFIAELSGLLGTIERADARPSPRLEAAVADAIRRARGGARSRTPPPGQ
jgi:photosystem II stability/assembly factor-like uncharacterized protein